MTKIPTYFVSRCPVCGRTLHIPVHLLGELLSCEHCRATFVAYDHSEAGANVEDLAAEIMQRSDLILSVVRNQRSRKSQKHQSPRNLLDGGKHHLQTVKPLISGSPQLEHIDA